MKSQNSDNHYQTKQAEFEFNAAKRDGTTAKIAAWFIKALLHYQSVTNLRRDFVDDLIKYKNYLEIYNRWCK